MKAIDLIKAASKDGTRFETKIIRELDLDNKIVWKDNSPRSLGGNMSYMIKKNETGMALYILSVDPYQIWHFCGKIIE